MARIRYWAESPTPYGPLFLLIEAWGGAVRRTASGLAVIAFRLWAMLAVAMLASPCRHWPNGTASCPESPVAGGAESAGDHAFRGRRTTTP